MNAEEQKAAWKAMEHPDGAEAGAAEAVAVAVAEAPREEDAVFEAVCADKDVGAGEIQKKAGSSPRRHQHCRH